MTAQNNMSPNGRPPTTLPEANRAEGNVGGALRRSSAEPQARGLQVTFFQVISIKGAAWVGLLGARTGLYQYSSAFASNVLCRANFTRSCDLYVVSLGATFLIAFSLSALSILIQEVAFQILVSFA